MDSILKVIKSSFYDFIEDKPQTSKPKITLSANHIITTIKKAQLQNASVSIFYDSKQVIGKITKYDSEKCQIRIKESDKKVISIIPLHTIEKISLLPFSDHNTKNIKKSL